MVAEYCSCPSFSHSSFASCCYFCVVLMFLLCAHYYYLQPNGIYVFHGFGHVCVNVMFIVTGHGKGGERKLCDGFVRQKFYIVNLFIAFMLIQMYVFVFVCVFSFWAIKIGAFVIPNEHSSK